MDSADAERERQAPQGPRMSMKPAFHDLPWRLILALSHVREIDGIECRVFEDAAIADEVFSIAAAALRLIAATDTRCYRRIRKHVATVLFAYGSGGQYLTRLRTCHISIEYARRVTPLELAMMIVHEATHARLWYIGCGYDDSVRERVERACVSAEIAFASRIPGSAEAIDKTRRLLETRWWTTAQHGHRLASTLLGLGTPHWIVRLLNGRNKRRKA